MRKIKTSIVNTKQDINFPQRIILIGFMGSGKTTVGMLLARELQYEMVDTDSLIEEEENMSISNLFETKGEVYFRKLESEMISQLAQRNAIVCSTGGGMAVHGDNMERLKEVGLVIYLKTGVETIMNRVSKSNNRPLLKDKTKKELHAFISSKLKERSPIYEKAQIVVMGGRPINMVVNTIIKRMSRI